MFVDSHVGAFRDQIEIDFQTSLAFSPRRGVVYVSTLLCVREMQEECLLGRLLLSVFLLFGGSDLYRYSRR